VKQIAPLSVFSGGKTRDRAKTRAYIFAKRHLVAFSQMLSKDDEVQLHRKPKMGNRRLLV
jgi:hypothetical protein